MEYERLIRDAWSITWHHRFLWLLGIFAGGMAGWSFGNGGGSVQYRTDARELEQLLPGAGSFALQVEQWVIDNLALIVLAGALVLLLGLGFLVLWLIAQGGMAEATADLASGRDSSLRQAWNAGLRLFWRYVGLWLVLAILAALVAAGVAALGAALFMLTTPIVNGQPNAGFVLGLILVGIPLVLAAIVASIGISIIVAYAQRAIFVQDEGPIAALRSGWNLLRHHLGTSLLVWVINLGLTIAAWVVVALVAIAVGVVLVGIGAVVWLLAGLTTPTIVFAALGALMLIGALVVLGGIANAFLWNYWTLAYLQLRQAEAG